MTEIALIIVLGIFAQWIAWKWRVPAILPLILIGLIVGPVSQLWLGGEKWIDPLYEGEGDHQGLFLQNSMFSFVSLAIGIILFEGGLTLKIKEIQGVGRAIGRLITLGSLVTFIGAAVAVHYLCLLSWDFSFLFAALIIVTGPTVIAPILRNVPLNRNVATVLKWEGILIDPIGALAAVLVYEFIIASLGGEGIGHFSQEAFITFVNVLAVGVFVGVSAALLLKLMITRDWIPHYLLNVFTLALVLLVFVMSDAVAHESGLLTVVVMGMTLANLKVPNLKEILDFKESLTILLISILFIILSANIDIAELQAAKKQWTVYQTTLRKKLVTVFQDKADLFGKKLLSDFLPRFLQEQGSWGQHRELVKSFDKFSTYFSGFHENRKNMYVADDKATAIANRAINDNLPKFFENILVHQTIRDSEHASAINLEHSQQLLARFGVDSVSDVFTPGFYLKLFSQHGIDAFEELIGGIKADDSDAQHAESVVGINQNINQYRQQFNQTNSEAKLTRRSFPLMVRLHKQILATSNTTSFSYEPYTNDAGMLADLAKLVDEYDINEGFFSNLKQIMQQLKGADSSTIFIRSNALSQLSYAWLNNHAILPRAFAYHVEISSDFTTKVSKEKQLKLVDNSAKTKTVGLFSMADIEGWLAQLMASQDADSNALIIAAQQKKGTTLSHYFHQTFDAQLASMNKPFEQLLKELSVILNQSALDANRRPPQTNGVDDVGGQGFLQVVTIQQYMEASLNLLNVFKPLHLVFKRKEVEAPEQQDKGFYNEFSTLFTLMSDGLLTVYNKTRNHVTKKPYKSEKVKINFENPTLLLGWDANKEKSNSCVLFEKQGNYYLGVMHPKHRALFDYVIGMDELGKEKIVEKKNKLRESIITEAEGYKKVIYKLVPGVNKMLPKVFFSASRVGFFAPSEEIHRIRNTASFSKHGAPQKEHQKADFNLSDCHTLIDFYKTSIERHYEWRQFNFVFSPTSTYQDISQFYKELQDQAYRIEFDTINPTYIDQCVADGKLFLFQIYNKDFSPFSTGTKNLHTLYWLGLFEADNLKDVVLKLNGEAEIFFRRHSIKQKDAIVHQANKPIDRKNPAQAGQISQFKHDIVKDKRYTKDKFFFHVPITLNHKAKQSPRFNDAINQAVTTDTNVIGIDRGERHLLYYCVVSSHGDILAQGSLNTIKPSGGGTPVDYHHKLNAREKQRDAARKSWTNVENIKELKAGYLSQVVHKLTHLMVEHKAIVCLEDLNFGFKKVKNVPIGVGEFGVNNVNSGTTTKGDFTKSFAEKLGFSLTGADPVIFTIIFCVEKIFMFKIVWMPYI